jgi:intracellular multiplication protein IcmL
MDGERLPGMMDIDDQNDGVRAGMETSAEDNAATSRAGVASTLKSAVTGKGKAASKAGAGGEGSPEMPPTGPLVTVITRNEFYRDGFRNMIRIAILEAFIILGLILAMIVHVKTSQPVDRYFATTADGRIMQLIPLDKESISQSALMSWVAQAASETMTFGYHDYQRRLQQSSRHFTRRGWESFTTALQKSRIIESITATQQVVTAEPRSAPILKQRGVFNGKYRWIVDLPLRVSYRAGTMSRTDSLNVTLVIERVPSLENPNGVGIEQWIATQR